MHEAEVLDYHILNNLLNDDSAVESVHTDSDILIPSIYHFVRPKEKHFPSTFAIYTNTVELVYDVIVRCGLALFVFIIIAFSHKTFLYF